MDGMDAFADVAVLQIHGGQDDDGAELVFDFNGRRISVSVFPSSATNNEGQDSIHNRIIALLNRAIGEVDDDKYEELTDEVLGVIMDAGRSILEAQGALHPEQTSARDIHSVMYSATHRFRLIDTDGKAALTAIAPNEAYTISGDEEGYDSAQEDGLDIDETLPSYSTKSILIDDVFVEGIGHTASLVTADGKSMFCKAIGHGEGLTGTGVGRELECLQQVRKLLPPGWDTPIRIPQLLGYVRHADSGRLVGFVREWVPGRRLRDIDIAAVPAQRRRKWLGQIDEAVRTLHAHRIIWGDGKAANVVIDDQDDAWLIDFGGGWTDGWVDEESAGTVEGFLQALSRIGAFLELE